jgi:hypothetical protein
VNEPSRQELCELLGTYAEQLERARLTRDWQGVAKVQDRITEHRRGLLELPAAQLRPWGALSGR